MDYGDGLFETLLVVDGHVPLRSFHFDRLQSGLASLHFPDVHDAVSRQLDEAVAALSSDGNYSVRITVTRGGGPRGYAPPATARPRIILSAAAMPRDPAIMAEPAIVGVSTCRWGKQPALAGVKHLNRLEQVLAAMERENAGWDEALMLDQAGAPISVTSGNLFCVSGQTLLTPILEDCGIDGTRRRFFIERCAVDLDLVVREVPLSIEDLKTADEVFYCNSLIGLRPVGELDGVRMGEPVVCARLFERYCKELTL